MPVDWLKEITALLHELQPWATVVGLIFSVVAARQASKGKEYGKKAVAQAVTAATKADIAASISQENAAKLDEVHKAVNGRMDQQLIATSEVARREGYDQGSADTLAMQKVSAGQDNSGQGG